MMNPLRLTTAIALFFVAALFSMPTALAQEAAGVDDDVAEEATGDIEEAQAAFDRGARYYYEGEFSSAIVEFRRANQIHAHPIFQHNIALSNRHLGRPERALEAALEADKAADELPPETAAINSSLVASLTTVNRAGSVASDVAAHREEQERQDEEPDAVGEAPEVEPSPEVEAASSWGGLGWVGAAGLGVGVAALGGAAVLDRQISNEISDIRAEGEGISNAQRNSLESRQTTGRVLLFSGAGMALVGATLVAVELVTEPSQNSRGVAIAPSIQRPGMEMILRW